MIILMGDKFPARYREGVVSPGLLDTAAAAQTMPVLGKALNVCGGKAAMTAWRKHNSDLAIIGPPAQGCRMNVEASGGCAQREPLFHIYMLCIHKKQLNI
jgi:hypothetical protein